MPKFADLQVSAFLEALASAEATPGGGTAAAMAGAMGTALLMMVARLSKSRTGTEDERVALAEAAASLTSVRDRLVALADTDSDAFNQVMAAYRLPKRTEAEKSARQGAIEQAMTAATTAPLDTLRAAGDAIRLGRVIAQHGNRSAASDVGVGIDLLAAAASGATANVRINLESLPDASFKSTTEETVATLLRAVESDAEAARAALR